jgi:hypothetical protein
MTITTSGRTLQPWPTRREREGGPGRRPSTPGRAGPRHAAADPDLTERLPIVVPQERPAVSAPVPAVAAGPAATSRPTPAPWRPVPATPPPRPAVGSAVRSHDGNGRPAPAPRNGLGVAALCLAAIGLPLGLVPVTGFVAAGLGIVALAFGIAGWSRTRSRAATNTGTAVTGAVLGLIALALGVAGTVAFLRAPDRLVYDLDALTAPAAVVTQIGE